MGAVPLPATLSGNIVQRLIEIDQALLYLVTGALDYAVINEPLAQTGALTVETAKNALSVMLQTYLSEEIPMTAVPVGSTMIWHMPTPPNRWLICDGTGVLKADYPQLYALLGGKYGESPDFFGLPDLRSRSPYGADFLIELDEGAGSLSVALITEELPAHSHVVTDPGHIHDEQNSSSPAYLAVGGAGRVGFGAVTTNSLTRVHTDSQTTGITLGNTGLGIAHDNLHPVRGVHFIIYAGVL
jgi:microcystin-dependent protein